MIVHLRGLKNTALAHTIWKEQWKNDWPGLSHEVTDICKNLEIEDVNTLEMENSEKKMMRSKVTAAAEEVNEKDVKSRMKTKCEEMKDDEVKLQEYFHNLTLYEARERFKIKSNMNKIRGNYKNMATNKQAGWRCVGCNIEVELNSHVMICGAYEDDRSDLEMNTDKGIVEFFRRVMKRRMTILDEEDDD